jgi:predicted secreted Zn-dependent protease
LASWIVGFAAAVTAAPSLAAQTTPKPSVVEKATIEYFNVRGSTVAAVSAELNRLSPRQDGRPVYGKYQYAFRYDYTTRVTAGGCEPIVTVGLTSTTMLPKWIDVSAGDSATQRQWSYFLNNLTVHENGHRTIALSIANGMQQSMSAIRAPSCAGLDAGLRAESNNRVAEADAEQIRYDAESNHGVKQGAIWPVPPNVVLLGRPPR